MQTPNDIPYWMRSIGRLLRGQCTPAFGVKLNLLHLLRVEGDMGVLETYPGLF